MTSRLRSSGASNDDESSQAALRRRLTRADIALKEMRLAAQRRELVAVDDVRMILAEELSQLRSRLTAMPGRLAQSLVGKDAAAIERLVNAEVVEALFDTPYGTRKFTVKDPDGNELGFVQEV